jgi:HK97 family phage major capsid protein
VSVLNRRERRLLARHGYTVNDNRKVWNRLPGAQARNQPPANAGPNPAPQNGPASRNTPPAGALPQTAGEWEHYLNGIDTPEKFTEAFEDGSFKAALSSYASAQNRERQDMLAQLREQTEAQLTDWLKENQDQMVKSANRLDLDAAKSAGARPSPVLNNPRAQGAPLNGIFPDFYTFLQDVWHLNRTPSNEQSERLRQLYNYSEKVPAEGGFMVPEEFRSQIMQLAMEKSVVRPRATIIPMGSPRVHIPSIDETSRVSSVFGGVVVYRTEEGAELTESQAAFSSIKLDVTKQTALAHVPNELIRDWGAFGAFIDATLPAAMGFYEDIDFLSGNGAGAPLGALHGNNTALIAVAAESGQAASTIVWQNVIKMYARMLPSSLDTAVWVASPDTFAELATMALNVGTGGSAVWLTDGRGRPVLTLLGNPVIMSEKAPAVLGTQGDLSFVDFSMYLVGDYQTMTIDSSPHVKFTSDKTTFRAIARNDGRPWLTSAITPHNNSASLSPFVQLATRS